MNMEADKITEAKNAILVADNQRKWRIFQFIVLLLVLGFSGEAIASNVPFVKDLFSWGFLTEMLGAVVTLVVVEIAFQQSEASNIKNINAWLEAAKNEKEAATEAKEQTELAMIEMQKLLDGLNELLEQKNLETEEYKSVAMQAMRRDLEQALGNLAQGLEKYRMQTDPQYAMNKTMQSFVDVIKRIDFVFPEKIQSNSEEANSEETED